MRVLVTGAAGFIGSHLAEALCGKGCDVIGVDNFDAYYSRDIKERNLSRLMSDGRFTFVEGDLRREETTDALCARAPDVVAHLAGRGGVRHSIEHPAEYLDLNTMATVRLFESMHRAGIRKMVFASTSSIYGNSPRIPFREDDPANAPISPYSASKKACEALCHTYHHLHGFDVYALRFFTVYGPRNRPDMAMYKFTRALCEGREIERYGDGSTERDYTYVDDIVDGVVRAVERVRGCEIINIGGSRTSTLQNLLNVLQSATGRTARLVERPIPPGDVMRTHADVSKAERLLNFHPTVGLEEGVRRFLDWYRQESQG